VADISGYGTGLKEAAIYTACNSHCGGACILKVHVKDGRIRRIETDDTEEPQFRACLKGRAYRQRVYHPDRLKYPLKRVGERGEGKFRRISWDAALDAIAAELRRVRDTYGPASILLCFSAADQHVLHNMPPIYKLLVQFGGCTAPWGFMSNEGAVFAANASFGTDMCQNTRDDLLNSKLIILWGFNPADTVQSTNTTWYLAQAREAGARIVCVDPRCHNTAAAFADAWIPIRPGTDTAMEIAMAYTILSEGLEDRAFLNRYTVGFDKFRDYVLGIADGTPKTPEWAEPITGVPAATIAWLARDYASVKPGALITGFGPGRSAYGEQFHRAAVALAAMTGNIGVPGGEAAAMADSGEFFGGDTPFKLKTAGRMRTGGNPVDRASQPREKILAARGTIANMRARVNSPKYADAILQGKSGGFSADYKFLFMLNANYVNQIPDTNHNVAALKQLEFFVVQEQFMTATAKLADIVLPMTTFMERDDFTTGGATPFFAAVNRVIPPLAECRSHYDIAAALAERLGITDFSDKTGLQWLQGIVEGYREFFPGMPDYDTLKAQRPYKLPMTEPDVAFRRQIEDPENHPFPTPSGKIEIYSEEMASWNDPTMPPIPMYLESWEGAGDSLSAKYPLQLITSHFLRRAHSQFENLPWLQELQTQALVMHPLDAAERGVRDGDMVRAYNDRGTVRIPVRLTQRITPGVVDLPQGAWFNPAPDGTDDGGCANVLTINRSSPRAAMNTNSGLVQVVKA